MQKRFDRARRRLPVVILPLFFLAALNVPAACEAQHLGVYDKTIEIVTREFYDQTFRGLPWRQLVEENRRRISDDMSEEAFEGQINGLLAQLKSSHTEFLSEAGQSYHALKSIFSGEIDGQPLEQIGAWFAKIDGRWFVRDVLQTSVAQKAGILAGDEILNVDGKPLEPVQSFRTNGQNVSIQLRSKQDGAIRTISLRPQRSSFQRVMLDATKDSRKVIPVSGKRVAYLHLWSGTHAEFQKVLQEMAVEMANQSDAFILDLRDGFGGAGPDYIQPFFDHDADGKPIAQIYSKPVVVVVNEGVRSGKEWLCFNFKKSKRATLVGSRTAGFFLAGKFIDIEPQKYALLLAVGGNGPQGVNLEGKGVEPDINVPHDFRFSGGDDPQLARALIEAAK